MKRGGILFFACLFSSLAFSEVVISISPGDEYISYSSGFGANITESGRNTGVNIGFGDQPDSPTPMLQPSYSARGLYFQMYDYTLDIIEQRFGGDTASADFSNGELSECRSTDNKFECGEGYLFGDGVYYSKFLAKAEIKKIKVRADPSTAPGKYTIPYGIASINGHQWVSIFKDSMVVNVLNRTCSIRGLTEIDLGYVLRNRTRTIDTGLDFKCDTPDLPKGAYWSFTEKQGDILDGIKIKLLDSDFKVLLPNSYYTDLDKLNNLKVQTVIESNAPTGSFSKSFLFTVTYS
ncbi:TPA: hypothetical protein ACMD0P_003259 [Vibrio parahaemolyticus]